MNPLPRLGFFLILLSVIYIFARQPFFHRSTGWMISEPSNTTSREILFFTRSESIVLSVNVPGNVNSTLVFLKPREIEPYLKNQSVIGVETSSYEGSFTTILQIRHRGIHIIFLNFNPPSSFLGLRIFSQGVSGSEYMDQLIVFAIGVILLLPLFLKRLKLVLLTRRGSRARLS